jgi:ABC-type multidrug transport system fused ATPase/permease subunit
LQSIPEEKAQGSPPGKAWPQHGGVAFVDARLQYRPGLPDVLSGLSFEVPPGTSVGICGRTGAGKSSLMVALFRMAELQGGRIEIDGVDIASVPLELLRASLSVIPQDPVLFSGTVRSNLAHEGSLTKEGDPIPDGQLREALASARLLETVDASPLGLDMEISEGGKSLSVGQRQLLCIARAMLREAKVVLLDEATSTVDSGTDAFIQGTIREVFKGSTLLTIAHRLETIMDYDRCLLLDKGAVLEYGPPAELMAAAGEFYKLASQKRVESSPPDTEHLSVSASSRASS